MTEKLAFDDMPLTHVLKSFLDQEEWTDEIKIGEDRKSASVGTGFTINDQVHRLFFEVNEEQDRFFVYIYSPFKTPPARALDMVRILNRINIQHQRYGRVAMYEDEDANPVQFRCEVDVEGATLAVEQINTMVQVAVNFFVFFGEVLAAVALTKQPVDKLWDEFLESKKADENDSDGSGNGPAEL